MVTWRVPERWAASSRSAMSARMRPLLVVGCARLAADRPDPMAAAGELADEGAPRASGRAEDHMQLVSTVHGRLLGVGPP